MADDLTQPSTQQVLDPRRLGRNNSGLKNADVSDVLCILHPGTPAAFGIVARTAQINPQHVLQNWEEVDHEGPDDSTFVIRSSPEEAQDLALRFSSKTRAPHVGFTFGRNPRICDIVLVDGVANVKRISNMHFRIYVNENGVIMLEDQSTNGTLVDDHHIKGRSGPDKPSTRIISNGSTIAIPSPVPQQRILFHVRIPPRDGHEADYRLKFDAYMGRMAALNRQGALPPHQPTATTSKTLVIQSNSYGMKWDGGPDYRVSGFLGKGAFANVYQLTTCFNGQYLAVKELEKRRFLKDGILDRRLDNEMQIMRSVNHPNIVKYMDYKDVQEHLYIIMEYVSCGDLQQYLKNGKILNEESGKAVARQVLEALNYLHMKKITHRDIKPDNILIDCFDPISIKLSDFGLSKVKTEETFLKTFCGTLLYCAPEVFPHSQNDGGGIKRRHGRRAHTYDHAVDIWSLGGVLWYAMSGSPPFEGVVDPTGRGMFDKITQNPPNLAPLVAKGVSIEAQDLLLKMLTIQPDRRPTATECLMHPWLFQGKELTQISTGLNSIVEEAEEADMFSQLSLGAGPSHDEWDDVFDDGDLEGFVMIDPAMSRSKRVKTDGQYPRNQMRASSEPKSTADTSAPDPSTAEIRPPEGAGRRKLFGEIGHSALADSGVLGRQTQRALGRQTQRALAIHNGPPSQTADRVADSMTGIIPDDSQPDHSLLGAESLVRDLNMESPMSSDWLASHGSSDNSMHSEELPDRQAASYSSEETPRAHHSRYESHADSTPTNRPRNTPLPETMYHAEPSIISKTPEAVHAKQLPVQVAREFELNRPKLGTLMTTEDSELSLYLPLNKRIEFWGRAKNNTLIYQDTNDTRIPKRAFCLAYHAVGIEPMERTGDDWTNVQGLRVFIKACSSHGIWVNGVHLVPENANGDDLLGYLRSGDIITIFQDKESEDAISEVVNHSDTSLGNSGGTLRFVCDFYHGEAKQPRSEPFTVLSTKKAALKMGPPTKIKAAVRVLAGQ